jgi:BolA protein
VTGASPRTPAGNPDGFEAFEAVLRERLAALDPLHLRIIDDSAAHAGHAGARSGGGHYRLLIVSSVFSGKSTLARHRLIYDALGELMRSKIHALSIQAMTPEEAR